MGLNPLDGIAVVPAEQFMNLFDYAEVEAARDAAMASVEDNANRVCDDFSDRAGEHVLKMLRARGPLSSEVLSLACKAAGIVPHDDRAFGPVYMRLSRGGLIVKAGFCARARGHGTSGGIVWKAVIDNGRTI